MTYALRFEHVTKVYRTGVYRSSLRELFGKSRSPETLKAIDDLTFTIEPGEAVGLIGHNGAGKTTMLKLLSRVTRATTGQISVNGRLSALIQLGAGFHPDLTGRDNVYLNGAILGLSRAEIRQRFDEIVAFAELEPFIDTPVKRYSSGMYARLGFAVAVHVSPEVLLVDEVLAVGDTAFQYKCFQKIREFVQSGRTVVFVSHNLQAVQGLCRRVLWLHQGRLRREGQPGDVIDAYLTEQQQRFVSSQAQTQRAATAAMEITEALLRNGHGIATDEFRGGDDLVVELHLRAPGVVTAPNFTIGVSDQGGGMLFLATTLMDGWQHGDLAGSGVVTCRFHGLPLMPKAYQVWGEVRDGRGVAYLVGWQPLCAFRVTAPPGEMVLPGTGYVSIAHLKDDAPVYVPHTWSLGPFVKG